MKCNGCGKTYRSDCDWQQGRCPLRPPLITNNTLNCDSNVVAHWLSFVASAARIAAGICLIWPQSLLLAGIFLIAAEIFNSIEKTI